MWGEYVSLCGEVSIPQGIGAQKQAIRLKDTGEGTSIAQTDDNMPTDGQWTGWKWRGWDCGDESEQERSRTGGGAGRREQLAPCPSAGAGTRRQAGEAELRRGRRGGDADAETPQAFKEGASTLRNAQNRIHISCSAAAWGVMG